MFDYYYQIAVIGSPLEPLTYKSDEKILEKSIVNITLRNKDVKGFVIKEVEKPSFKCQDLKATNFYIQESYLKIIDFISLYYTCSIGEAVKLFVPFQQNATPIKKENFLLDVTLSDKQKQTYDFLSTHPSSLLFGDTGSGKTEIYMKFFEKMVNEGKTSLFLVPEIGLTPQLLNRVKDKFKDKVAVWHSKITPKAKERLLDKIYDGDIKIIIGTRSALFLPLLNLGLIVVDEEHDDSYKSSFRPRINVRDLSLLFGQTLNIKVVLGSATPSLTTYHKIPHFRLKGRFFENKKNYIFDSGFDMITPKIKEKLKNLGDEQAIIFLPTRANFKYIICGACTVTIKCPNCSIALSQHSLKNMLKCHYCNFTQAIPKICTSCGAKSLSSRRMGTAEVASQLESFLPEKKIQKFDRDEVTTQRKLTKILDAFNDKEIDILVGTQMVSKGHDYHNVNLVVILGIDGLLGQADFRAREKAISLMFQISGRSGRKSDGEVVIQTQHSDFFKLFLDDYELFLKDEITYREDSYPPFRRLMRFLISHKDIKKAKEGLDELLKCVKTQPNIEIIGHGESLIFKIANRYRYNLLIRAEGVKPLLQTAYQCKKTFCEIDIDPINFA